MSNVYREPGVISSEVEISGLVSIPGGAQIPAVVGTGTNYILQRNAPQVRGTTSTDTIVDLTGVIMGVSDVVSVISVGSLPGLADYKLTTDYTISNNVINWSPAGAEPVAGATYYITFKKAKPITFYDPILFFDPDDVRGAYGYELENGEIRSATLAALLQFAGGASQVIGVQQASNSYSDFVAAIDKLKTEEIDLLSAPGMTFGDTYRTYAITHVNQMCSELEGKERMLFIGASQFNTSITDQAAETVSISNEKIVYVEPPSVKILLHDYGTGEDVLTEVSSHFAGASLIGVASNPNYDTAEPLLRKTLPLIADLGKKYLRSEQNYLASNGGLVLFKDGADVKVRHDLTTSLTNANTQQISIIRTKFFVAKRWRKVLNRLIGSKITSAIVKDIGLTSSIFFQQLVESNTIVGFRALKVKQDPLEPRRIKVYAEIAPIYPLVWVDVTFALYVQTV
jgi:hypothetical protein